MKAIKQIVKGRKVAILGSGPSLQNLTGLNTFCIAVINNLHACESIGVNIHAEIFCCGADTRFYENIDEVREFVKRPYPKVLITKDYLAKKFNITNYSNIALFMEGHNSLANLLLHLILSDTKEIYLFGMDGFVGKEPYYEKDKYFTGANDANYDIIKKRIERDTVLFNNRFWQDLSALTNKQSSIINVSDNTDLTCFPIMSTEPLMKVYLFNDTSTGDSGSQAVMRSLNYRLKPHKIIARHKVHEFEYDEKKLEECEAVIVNGEGTMHHNAKAAMFLISILKKAQDMSKFTALINSVYQEIDAGDVLNKLDVLITRDLRSHNAAGQGLLMLDSCVDPHFLNKEPIMVDLPPVVFGDIHGGSPVTDFQLKQYQFTLSLDFSDIVANLKQCDVYITGQHHGIYAAGLAGIPFVAMASNSHKIEGLIEWSKIPIPVCYNMKEVEKATNFAYHNQSLFEDFHYFLSMHDFFRGIET